MWALLAALGAVATPAGGPRAQRAGPDGLDAAGAYRFRHLRVEDGLSQGTIRAIIQDRRGFMWFGSYNGVNRFDGHEVRVYAPVPFDTTSFPGGHISALSEGRDGSIWVATRTQGVSRLDPLTGRFRRYPHVRGGGAVPAGGFVNSILEDVRGRVWIGTDRGLLRLEPQTGSIVRHTHRAGDGGTLTSDVVFDVVEDASGGLWIGTDNGVTRLDPRTGRFTRHLYSPAVAAGRDGPDRVVVEDLLLDPGRPDVLWASGRGLVRLDTRALGGGRSRRFWPEPDRPATDSLNRGIRVAPDPVAPGIFWLTTFGHGLLRFDADTGHFLRIRRRDNDPHSLLSDRTYAIQRDRTGGVWIGMGSGQGLSYLFPDATGVSLYRHPPGGPNGIAGEFVTSVLLDRDGLLWVGTEAGLNRIDRRAGTVRIYRHDASVATSIRPAYVESLLQDASGTLWAGTRTGLSRMDRRTDTFTHYVHDRDDPTTLTAGGVRSLVEHPRGTIWVATFAPAGGLNRLDVSTGEIARYQHNPADSSSLSHNAARVVLVDAAGRLWVGTEGGLNRMDQRSGRFTRFVHDPRDRGTLSHSAIRSLHERRRERGILWVGTESGLNRLDTRTGRATHFTTADGLPDDVIYAILEDADGRLWLSTNRGLAQFDPDTRDVRPFGSELGLQAMEFNSNTAFRSPEGEMFFGGVRGLNAFYPMDLAERPAPPQVEITGVRLFNRRLEPSVDGPLRRPLPLASEVRLRHDENNVAFEYVALHYRNPGRNRYWYRLDGFDADWVDAGTSRLATYTSLPEGSYIFRVRAASSDGAGGEAQLSVRVSPPFWRTWWFRGLELLALGMLGAGAYSLSASRRRAAEELRLRIATDLHDELGSGLTRVTLYGDLIARTVTAEAAGNGRPFGEAARVASWANSVVEQTSQLSGSMRDAVWAIRPDADNWESLEMRLKDAAVAILEPRAIDLDMEGEVEGGHQTIAPEVRQNVLLFVKEALHNAVRHAGASRVEVRWRLSQRSLLLHVADDGAGFDPTAVPRGTGLLSLRRRAELLGGAFTLDTARGRGTRIAMEVPLRRRWSWPKRRRARPT